VCANANGDWPAVTQEAYNLAFEARVARKREVLDAWATELRRIVGANPEEAEQSQQQRLAA